MERPLETATLAGTSDHERPPSVERNNPTPASESPEPFGSPVPTYRVFPLGSVGSTAIDPIASDVKPFDIAVHVGGFASASSVRQMPPPAAPTHKRQFPETHVRAIASDVIRPEMVVRCPDASVPPTFVTNGPTGVHGLAEDEDVRAPLDRVVAERYAAADALACAGSMFERGHARFA
jgi:hypothetical protein